jgi:hypothetical protein
MRLLVVVAIVLGLASAAVAQGCRNMSCTTAGGITTCVCF